jgi:hypothetical protein
MSVQNVQKNQRLWHLVVYLEGVLGGGESALANLEDASGQVAAGLQADFLGGLAGA